MGDITYRIEVWCGDCLGDRDGCFDGRTTLMDIEGNACCNSSAKPAEFASKSEAEDFAWEQFDDGGSMDAGPYQFEIIALDLSAAEALEADDE